MGCGQTLALGEGGGLVCTGPQCPRPTAAHELLDDQESEHVVEVDGAAFMLRHPLRERLDDDLDDLLACRLHAELCSWATRPPFPFRGRYRLTRRASGWSWEALPSATPANPGDC